MQSKLDVLMKAYREAFDEQFPLMLVQGVPDKEIAEIIEDRLRSGKPYEPEPDLKY